MLTWSIVYAGILVWVSALAQHFNNLFVHGAKWVASDRSKLIPEDGFTGRSTRALRNNLESAAMYVPVALAALTMNEHSPIVTRTARWCEPHSHSATGRRSTPFVRSPGSSA